jgi:hypothetical protein
MSIAKMVREMIAKGVDPDVIELAVATAEQVAFRGNSTGIPVDETAEKRRAYDRERKRRSTGIPPDSTGIPRNSENASLSKEEKIEESNSEREAPKRNSRGQRLPDDWAPTAIDHAISHEMLGPDRARSELEKFRDHWKQQPGSKGVKLDWDAAWRNWIRRAAEYRGGTNGQRNFNETRRSASDNLLAGFARVAANIAGDDQPPRNAAEEIPSGRFNIDG